MRRQAGRYFWCVALIEKGRGEEGRGEEREEKRREPYEGTG